MSEGRKFVTISGRIVRHMEEVFWGRITINKASRLITKVERGEGLQADYMFGPDCLIFAGFGDVHIHTRQDDTGKQDYKETYETAANAALHGGVVHVSGMPNFPNPLVSAKELLWHRNRVAELDHPVVILNYIGVDKETRPVDKKGENPYKVYFGKSVGSLTIIYASELDKALARYQGEHVSFHVEYEPIVLASVHGKTHSDRRPVECVNEGLRLLLPLIEKYKIKAKLCHWSTGGESFELIQEYRGRGCEILLEVSPLHLYFDTSQTGEDPSLWMQIQMNPAVQEPKHRFDLVKGLRTGFIDMLATDHAPHTEEEKYVAFAKFRDGWPRLSEEFSDKTNKEIATILREKDRDLFEQTCVENNTSGAPWLDTYALICTWLMHEHGFTPQDIARVAAYNPGQFVNRFLPAQFPGRDFGNGFGEIAEGYMGSLTVLNTARSTTVRREDLKTKVGWSALEGHTFPGAVEAVFIGGSKY